MLGWAIMTMVVLLLDQLFWKPLVVMADRYKLKLGAGEERRFWIVDLWRTASVPGHVMQLCKLDRRLSALTPTPAGSEVPTPSHATDLLLNIGLLVDSAVLTLVAARFILHGVGFPEVLHAFLLGAAP